MIDIIIPTYNNKEGLIQTLESIPSREELKITIVDDCSQNIDYSDINYNIIFLSKNSGPGVARQYGLDSTSEPYFMFIDTGDYFLENVFDFIISDVVENPDADVFKYLHVNEKNRKAYGEANNRLHGNVYKRSFICAHNITFCAESSYANEDIGFNRACRLFTTFKYIPKPIYIWEIDPNSLTRKNAKEFEQKKQDIGLALNAIYNYKMYKDTAPPEKLEAECSEIMGHLHGGVVESLQYYPENISYAWHAAKLFYDEVFINYNYITDPMRMVFNKTVQRLMKNKERKKSIPLNLQRFLNDLAKYDEIPEWYLS